MDPFGNRRHRSDSSRDHRGHDHASRKAGPAAPLHCDPATLVCRNGRAARGNRDLRSRGFLVAQQTREIGIRIALGATPRNVLTMILLNMVRWTAAGAALGILGAWLSTRFLESLLFEVRAHDPIASRLGAVRLLAWRFLPPGFRRAAPCAWIPWSPFATSRTEKKLFVSPSCSCRSRGVLESPNQ